MLAAAAARSSEASRSVRFVCLMLAGSKSQVPLCIDAALGGPRASRALAEQRAWAFRDAACARFPRILQQERAARNNEKADSVPNSVGNRHCEGAECLKQSPREQQRFVSLPMRHEENVRGGGWGLALCGAPSPIPRPPPSPALGRGRGEGKRWGTPPNPRHGAAPPAPLLGAPPGIPTLPCLRGREARG